MRVSTLQLTPISAQKENEKEEKQREMHARVYAAIDTVKRQCSKNGTLA